MIGKHVVLTVVVGAGIGLAIYRYFPAAWTAVQAVGIVLAVVGFIFWTVARFQLGSSFAVSAQARKLVTNGLYTKIRNPIYVFGSFVIGGMILVIGRPVWLVILVLIIPLQIQRARKEASVLEAAFGEEYRKYRAGTWF